MALVHPSAQSGVGPFHLAKIELVSAACGWIQGGEWMKHLLYIAPFCHIPPADGASQRGINLLRQLQEGYRVTLLTYRKHDPQALQQWAHERQVTLYWLADPPPRRETTFFRRLVAARPPGFASHDPQAIANAIDEVWDAHGPFDILYFATQLMGQAALIGHWSAQSVLDLYDVSTPIARSKIKRVPIYRPYHWLFRIEAVRVRKYERRIIELFEFVLVPSQKDAKAVTALCPRAPVKIIPNGVNMPPERAGCGQKTLVLLVGNYGYAPNAQGFRWFYEEVWPSVVTAFPAARLCLVGQGGHMFQAQIANDKSVDWAGRVPDVSPYYQEATCAIIPIFSGGGTRLKLLEAMAWEVPIVTTTFGAEGINHAGTVAVADTPEQFAKAVIRCLESPEVFAQSARQARQLVAEHYSWAGIGQKLRGYLSAQEKDR
jgi:glycosyltransferase involved in cell wall biosynthesis